MKSRMLCETLFPQHLLGEQVLRGIECVCVCMYETDVLGDSDQNAGNVQWVVSHRQHRRRRFVQSSEAREDQAMSLRDH